MQQTANPCEISNYQLDYSSLKFHQRIKNRRFHLKRRLAKLQTESGSCPSQALHSQYKRVQTKTANNSSSAIVGNHRYGKEPAFVGDSDSKGRPESKKNRNLSDMAAEKRKVIDYTELEKEADTKSIRESGGGFRRQRHHVGKIKRNLSMYTSQKKMSESTHQSEIQRVNEKQKVTEQATAKDIEPKSTVIKDQGNSCSQESRTVSEKELETKQTVNNTLEINLEESHYLMVLQHQKMKCIQFET